MSPAEKIDTRMIVQLTAAELEEMFRRMLREAVTGMLPAAREFLTQEQLAKRLGISARSVQRMINRDGMPVHELGPKLQRFLWSEVEQWLISRGKNTEAPLRRGGSHLRHVRSPK